MVSTTFAKMDHFNYPRFAWASEFRTNKQGSYYQNETRFLQRTLNSAIVAGLTVDGIFGQATTSAVRAYQRARYPYLNEDGIVGSLTWNDLQTNINWSATSRQYSSGRKMYYYGYKSIHDIAYYIRHYEDGAWYVLDRDGKTWYGVN